MKTVIEMAREAGLVQESEYFYSPREEEADVHIKDLERFAELVRADERNSWPLEMEAMERQVNILTDALNDRQRWFDAMTAQHKQEILAEREACAKVCDWYIDYSSNPMNFAENCAQEIRARETP